MISEALMIEQENGDQLTVRLAGDHLTVDANDPASNAYLMTVTLSRLIVDGTVFAKIEELFGVRFIGSVTME